MRAFAVCGFVAYASRDLWLKAISNQGHGVRAEHPYVITIGESTVYLIVQ